jgi:hypothetical protein
MNISPIVFALTIDFAHLIVLCRILAAEIRIKVNPD